MIKAKDFTVCETTRQSGLGRADFALPSRSILWQTAWSIRSDALNHQNAQWGPRKRGKIIYLPLVFFVSHKLVCLKLSVQNNRSKNIRIVISI